MLTDELSIMRKLEADAGGNQSDALRFAVREIMRCHARLEIDHYFTMDQFNELVRVEIPYDERSTWTDGVECRDVTISMLEKDGAA